MKVSNLNPNVIVAAYVERVLVIEHPANSPFSLPLFANGVPTLLFTSTKGMVRNRQMAHLTLFGQTILPETLNFPEGFVLIAYFFKPYALGPLFGIMAPELTDKPIDLHLLTPKKTITLEDRLLHTRGTKNRIILLDHYISGLIAGGKKENPIIQYATDKMVCQPSNTVLTLVQKELYLTERTFQRMFEKNIGIRPNLYRRICQFNTAFQQLNNRAFAKLSDIAFENGYTDQSHYIRSFREFTDLSPKDYLHLGTRP